MRLRYIAVIIIILLLSSCAVTQWQPQQYVVRKGDTLYGIAWRYNVDYEQLASWNNIPPPYTISSGQKIWLAEPNARIASASPTRQSANKPIPKSDPKSESRQTANNQNLTPVNWRWPLDKPYNIIQQFAGQDSASQGIDIQAAENRPVFAAAAGNVVYSGDGLVAYGNLVIIKHNDEYLSAYALNKKLFVKEGQTVKRGQKIATVGLDDDKNPVLYFEIRRYGKPVNPIKYLP